MTFRRAFFYFNKNWFFEICVFRNHFSIVRKKKWHSIIYWFRKMTAFERNYDVKKQKFFVIIEICKKWKHYVKNFKFFVRIIIDYANFCTFLTIKTLNRKKTRWWKRLSNFDLKIKHKFDKKNSANKSSRRRNYEKQITIENQQKIDKFLKIFIFLKTNNFEILNIWNWILMNLKNLFFNDFRCQNQNLKRIQKKMIYNCHFVCDRKTDRRKIEKQSVFKNSYFKKNYVKCIKIFRYKKSSVWIFDKFENWKIFDNDEKIFEKTRWKISFAIKISKNQFAIETASFCKCRKLRRACISKNHQNFDEQKFDFRCRVIEVEHRI